MIEASLLGIGRAVIDRRMNDGGSTVVVSAHLPKGVEVYCPNCFAVLKEQYPQGICIETDGDSFSAHRTLQEPSFSEIRACMEELQVHLLNRVGIDAVLVN